MIVDSSALLSLVFREPAADRIADALSVAESCAIGAPTLTETAIVLAAKLGPSSRAILSRLVEELDLVIVPFTAAHGREAREAFLRYGRGRHLAALNFGDCLTYAVARIAARPLLFVGEDFRRTDLESVLDSQA